MLIKMNLMPLVLLLITFNASSDETIKNPWQVKFDKYTKDLPEDVVGTLKRMNECHYWAGEEPYDQSRRKQILKAVKALKCEQLSEDRKNIVVKYKNRPIVQKKLEGFMKLK